ncbi:MAG: DNA-protecting protein DprA [Candidatus Accumulibacter sp.]|nr:DNA-protecting protein DprA [Accumulibacter sp.]
MKISNNALNVLAAKTYKGIGRAWIVKHICGDEATTDIVTLLNEDSKEGRQTTQDEFDSVKEKILSSVDKSNVFMDGVVAIGDKDFPFYRGDVKNGDRPVVLFYRGDLSLLDKTNRNIAVIGLLNPDKDTETVESEVVSKLVNCGATIISGLAVGCDTIAHEQALRSAGKTVAILPSPLDEILPSINKKLADKIVEKQGLLVTEYYESTKSKMELNGRYQERDRLQALFSDCVVLTASYAKNDLGNDSGSRLAMEYAANYSIPRSVIYNPATDVLNKKYDLNRQLIREQNDIIVINK